jgi:electron transport complex protein RnfB
MHTVVAELCTGCDLCVPPCPVDCISMPPVTGDATGWDAWSQPLADAARERHNRREARLAREREAAEARVAARRSSAAASGATTAATTAPTGNVSTPSASPASTAENADAEAKKRAIIQAALERARKKKEELAAKGHVPLNTDQVSADVQAQIDAAEARRRRLGLTDTGVDQLTDNPADDPAGNPPPSTPVGTRNPR